MNESCAACEPNDPCERHMPECEHENVSFDGVRQECADCGEAWPTSYAQMYGVSNADFV